MGEKNRPLFVPSPSLLDEYLPMIVTDQHGVRRRPLLRGTITLTLPAVLLLLVLITRNLFFVELSPTDIDQGISGETHVDGGKVVDWKPSGITVYLDKRKKTVCCRDKFVVKN